MDSENLDLEELFAGQIPAKLAASLRSLWQASFHEDRQGASAEKVLSRLEAKYQPLFDRVEREQGAMAADRLRERWNRVKSLPLAVAKSMEGR